MTENLKIQKEALRAEAIRARGLLTLNASEHEVLCSNFFDNIEINDGTIVAAYWAKDRELDTQILIDECLERCITIALPVIQDNDRILKFAGYDNNTDMVNGKFDIPHPVINEDTKWLEPDIFLLPLLAFDRKGNRLGFGGGYFDATLEHYKAKKNILAIGIAYAEQACLFNLPSEEHDIKMDWVITQQNAQDFR